MLSRTMGLILADHARVDLGSLTGPRALAAVPFAGRYRVIDFLLSSMVNSGIKNIGVATFTKYKSLMDHVGNGLYWDLARMHQGLQILPPFLISPFKNKEGNDLSGLIEFLQRGAGRQDYVVLVEPNMILNLDLEEVVRAHISEQADITILYRRDAATAQSPNYVLDVKEGLVREVYLDPGKTGYEAAAIGLMVMAREFLETYLREQQAKGNFSFSIEALLRLHGQVRMRAQVYEGCCLRINSTAAYFRNSLAVLDPQIRQELFREDRPVFTKVKNEAPAMYAAGSSVSQAMISDGCQVAGAVENSIFFRGVHLAEGAVVRHSIIMQNVRIGAGAHLEHVIIDKNVQIRPGVSVQGHPDYPLVIEKGVTL